MAGEAATVARFHVGPAPNLRPQARRVLEILADGQLHTRKGIADALYCGREDGGPLWANTCVSIAIANARRWLRGRGARVLTIGKRGYRLVWPGMTEPAPGSIDALFWRIGSPTMARTLGVMLDARAPLSGADLAARVGVNLTTLRTIIVEWRPDIAAAGWVLRSRPHTGYWLERAA